MKMLRVALILCLFSFSDIQVSSATICMDSCFQGVRPNVKPVWTPKAEKYLDNLDLYFVPLWNKLGVEIIHLKSDFTPCDNEQRRRVRRIFQLHNRLLQELETRPDRNTWAEIKVRVEKRNNQLSKRLDRFQTLLEQHTGRNDLQGIINVCDQYLQQQSASKSEQPRN